MTKPSSTQYDEPSDVTATRRQKTSPPPPRLHGRLVGSLQGAAAGAARVAVLRDSRSQDVLAHARISPDGSFETAELPAGLRGRSLTVDVIIADPDGPSTAASVSVDIPRTGDASVIVHPGAFGSDAGSLSPSPEVLDPTRFGELLQGHEASTAAFAQMRKAARRRTPPIAVDLSDDTLQEVLNGVEEAESGAAVEYEVRRAALIEQSRNSQQLVTEYDGLESAARRRRDEIVRLMEGEGLAEAGEPGTGQRIATGILTGGVSELFGGGTTSADERLQAQREAAQQALGYLEKQIEIKGAAMTAAAEALRRAVDRFTEAAVQRRRTALATARLQVHIRDNIFHYMHAIWAVTHPDNRFFELYDNEVPFHTPNPADYTLRPAPAPAVLQNLPGIEDTGTDLELTIAAPDTTTVPPLRRLADIADLDRPLGFRGNLVIFELRQCSQLTDHMVAEYLDPVSGIADPGALSGISTGELIDYIEAAIQAGILDDGELNRLKEIAHQLHRDQRDWADELVLPTGQLFLEALKGQTTLLEPFKLVHRGLDALSAEEDVRAKRIDALRRVRKLAQSDLERDPTSVEHFYLGEIPGVAVTNGDGSGPGGGE